MAGQILCLLEDKRLRWEMGRQAAEDAAQRFGMERVIKDYLLFYENIVC
jgi:glycosyltransferase involved in cell wall biosynthesis